MTAAGLRRAFVAGSLGWVALLPIAAYASAHPGRTGPTLVSAAVYGVGAVVCHQLPARSFALWAQPLPVCARCTGIYVGAALIALYSAIRAVPLRFARSGSAARWLLGAAALPTLVTVAYEWSAGVTPSNTIRAVAALSLGAAASAIVLASAGDQVN